MLQSQLISVTLNVASVWALTQHHGNLQHPRQSLEHMPLSSTRAKAAKKNNTFWLSSLGCQELSREEEPQSGPRIERCMCGHFHQKNLVVAPASAFLDTTIFAGVVTIANHNTIGSCEKASMAIVSRNGINASALMHQCCCISVVASATVEMRHCTFLMTVFVQLK